MSLRPSRVEMPERRRRRRPSTGLQEVKASGAFAGGFAGGVAALTEGASPAGPEELSATHGDAAALAPGVGVRGLEDAGALVAAVTAGAEPVGSSPRMVASEREETLMLQAPAPTPSVVEVPLFAAATEGFLGKRVFPTGSLFCFSFVGGPNSSAARLVRAQSERHASIFACDEAAVWSSEVFQVTDRLATLGLGAQGPRGEVAISQSSEWLLTLWGAVIAHGRFREHSWAVRVDPDCVFFPGRVHRILSRHHAKSEDEGSGVQMSSCLNDDSPIQILSRKAVEVLASGSDRCAATPDRARALPARFGEESTFDWCLSMVLGVQLVSDRRLLADERCGTHNVEQCSHGHVAFHPFETQGTYEACLSSAHAAARERVAI